jgi:hypothetical protein
MWQIIKYSENVQWSRVVNKKCSQGKLVYAILEVGGQRESSHGQNARG